MGDGREEQVVVVLKRQQVEPIHRRTGQLAENPVAAFGLFDTEEGVVDIRRVPYDVEGAIAAIEEHNLPRILGERLRLGK